MIKFRCPICRQKLGVPDEYEGRRIHCSRCAQPSMVPRKIVPIAQPAQNPAGPVPFAAVAQAAPASVFAAVAATPKPVYLSQPEVSSRSATMTPDMPEPERKESIQDEPNGVIFRDYQNSLAHKIDLQIPSRRHGRAKKNKFFKIRLH